MTTPTPSSSISSNGAAAGSAALEALLRLPPPIVQVSIDVPEVQEAIDIGHMAKRAGVDLLEFGTPLVLSQGLSALDPFKAAFPNDPVLADVKIVDGAKKYVLSAAAKGADFVTICGVAHDASIRQALEGQAETGIVVVVDLYAAPDPVQRAREVVDMGAAVVLVHYGGDARTADEGGDDTLEVLPRVKDVVDVPVGVVTFDPPGGRAAVEAGADIVLIGHPYLLGAAAETMLTDYVQQVKSVRG
ncbi:MAG: orotidine 5'-phosphate decarboxylase / HUMPS family protein [Candidatus Limnocylindrales bacterium]